MEDVMQELCDATEAVADALADAAERLDEILADDRPVE